MITKTDIKISRTSHELIIEFPSIDGCACIQWYGDDTFEVSAKIGVDCTINDEPTEYYLTVYSEEFKPKDISDLITKTKYIMFNILKIQECSMYNGFDKFQTFFGNVYNKELFTFYDGYIKRETNIKK